LHIDGSIYECNYGLERVDVYDVYKEAPNSRMSGFEVEVSFSESGEKCISLEVVLESGRNIRMEEREV